MSIKSSEVFRSVENQGKKMTKVDLYEWITELMIDNRLLKEIIATLNKKNERHQKELERFLNNIKE